MKKYFKYLRYLLRHKWYVMIECFKIGLFWRGLVHDMSKFLPDEFIPYARYFYSANNNIQKGRDSTGYYKPTDTGDIVFDFAWLLHQKRNRHHWQWWILPEGEGGVKVLEMKDVSRREMICDWIGAGKAQGKISPKIYPFQEVIRWWNANNHKMQLHPRTRRIIETSLYVKQII